MANAQQAPPVPYALLSDVPQGAQWAMAFVAPQQAAVQWQDYTRAFGQQNMASSISRSRARMRTWLAIDPWVGADWLSAGLNVQSGMVLLAMPKARVPVLLAEIEDEPRFRTYLQSLLRGETSVPQWRSETIGQATVCVASFGAVGLPGPSYAREGKRLWLAPAGGAAALKSALQQRQRRQNLAQDPFFAALVRQKQATPAWVTLLSPGLPSASRAGNIAHLAAINFGKTGLAISGALARTPELPTLPASALLPEACGDSTQTLLTIRGASLAWTRALYTQAPKQTRDAFVQLLRRAPAAAAVLLPMAGISADALSTLPEPTGLATALQAADGPFCGSVTARPTPTVWAAAASIAGSASKKWTQAVQSLCRSKTVRCQTPVAGNGWRHIQRSDGRGPQAAFLAPLLAIGSDAQALAQQIAQATPKQFAAPSKAAPGCALSLTAQMPRIADAAREALSGHAAASILPMPQLLMAGPLGEGLQELSALGIVAAQLHTRPWGLAYDVTQAPAEPSR